MSLDALEWVASITTGSSSRKLVLAALANYHNRRTGLCCPSKATLVRFTELNEKTIQRALDDLVAKGLISIEKRPGRVNLYALHITTGETHATTPNIAGGCKQGGVPKVAPNPPQNQPEPPPIFKHEQGNGKITSYTLHKAKPQSTRSRSLQEDLADDSWAN